MSHSETITTHVDKNVGPFYDGDALLVYEYFFTVQGEAPFVGTPAVFLRLGGCNRGSKKACPFCDTAFELANSTRMTFVELFDALYPLLSTIKGPPLLVVTGGEPAIQLRALRDFLEYLDNRWTELGEINDNMRHLTVQIETNGDYDLRPLLIDAAKKYELIDVHIVVSPKEPFTKKTPWFFGNMKMLRSNVYIRRVVCAEEQSVYHAIPKWLADSFLILNRTRIYLSPQTVYLEDGTINRRATLENIDYAVRLAANNGIRISFQSHAYIGVR